MAKFEVVSLLDAPRVVAKAVAKKPAPAQKKGIVDEFLVWMYDTVDRECKQRGVAVPPLKVRYGWDGHNVEVLKGTRGAKEWPTYLRDEKGHFILDANGYVQRAGPSTYHKWVKTMRRDSSGYCRYGRNISFVFGSDIEDRKLVVLHELAHWFTPYESHSQKFWDVAFRLFKKYKLDAAVATNRSVNYKKKAAKSAAKVFGS